MRAKDGSAKRWIEEVALPYKGDECLLFPFSANGGQRTIGSNGKSTSVGRYVCEATYGPPPFPKANAAHRRMDGSPCRSPACCTPAHLRWATRDSNLQDRISHGTYNKAANALADLSKKQRQQIRKATGTFFEISRQFGVSQTTVRIIKRHL